MANVRTMVVDGEASITVDGITLTVTRDRGVIVKGGATFVQVMQLGADKILGPDGKPFAFANSNNTAAPVATPSGILNPRKDGKQRSIG